MFITHNTIMFLIVCFISLCVIATILAIYAYTVNQANKKGYVTKKEIRYFENRVDRDIDHLSKKVSLLNQFIFSGDDKRVAIMKDIDDMMDNSVEEIANSIEDK